MRIKTDKQLQADIIQQDIVIPKENAVFWMDENGHWYNEGGRFELKKVIRRFNASIRKDAGGYFLIQINGSRREKIYFPYEETALFAIDLTKKDPLTLRLNTGIWVPLNPECLFVAGESLYTIVTDDWIKFAERSLLKISTIIDYEKNPYIFSYKVKVYPILNKSLHQRIDFRG